jgi:glycerol-3-phosphate cytidylyltransferase-like family protein
MERAAKLGRLFVGIGTDKSIEALKKRSTINKQQERLYMVKSIRFVEDAWINGGEGLFDFFDDDLSFIDMLVVNRDQDFKEKREWCRKNCIEYIVFEEKQSPDLPVRSSTQQRKYLKQRKW